MVEVRDAWSPPEVLVTEPRRSRSDVWQRYMTLADWPALDRPHAHAEEAAPAPGVPSAH